MNEWCLHFDKSSIGHFGIWSILYSSTNPSRNLSTPVQAIITPLSVHRCEGGEIKGILYRSFANFSKLKKTREK